MEYEMPKLESQDASIVYTNDMMGMEMFIATLSHELRETKESVMYDIGIGGSILGDVVEKDGTIYFGACDKIFYAVDAATGKEKWRFPTEGIIIGWTLKDDTLYATSYDHHLYALTLDGRLLWKFRAEDKLAAIPFVHNGRIYFGCRDGNLYAITTQGKLVWKYSEGSPLSVYINGKDDTIYFGTFDGHFVALDENKNVKWKFRTQGLCGGANLFDDMIVFTSWDHHIYAVDFDGNLKWKFQADQKISIRPMPKCEDLLYFGSFSRNFYCLDRQGKLQWKLDPGGIVFGFPLLDEDNMYFGTSEKVFYCLDPKTGAVKWKFNSQGPIASKPVRSGSRIIFGGYDCKLYALDMEGNLDWTFPTSLSYIAPISVSTPQDITVTEVNLEIADMTPKPKKDIYGSQATQEQIGSGSYGEFSPSYVNMSHYVSDAGHYTGKKKKSLHEF